MTTVLFVCRMIALLAVSPTDVNRTDLKDVHAPVTINNGAVSFLNIKNNNAPITVSPRITDRQLKKLTPEIVEGVIGPVLKKLEELNLAKVTDSGWAVSDPGPLMDAVERVARETERSQDMMREWRDSQRRHDAREVAMFDMLTEWISHGRAEEAARQMEQDGWRTRPGWGVGVAGVLGAPTRTVSGGVGGSVEATWSLTPLARFSTWDRAVRPFAGVTAGYTSMWREKQWFGYPNGSDIGIVREDLFGLGAVAGVLSQWEHFLAGFRVTGLTRPFSGLGFRGSVGLEGGLRFGGSHWWLRAGIDYAPYDSGAAVPDLVYTAVDTSTDVTSHVASSRFEGSIGLLALFP